MFLFKFVVSIIILLQISINHLNGQWNNASNSSNNIQFYENTSNNYTKNNGTDVISLNGTISNNGIKVDRMANKNTKTKDSDDDEFHFLITGGYRPEKNEYIKYVVSIRRMEKEYHAVFGDSHFCCGGIISVNTILTAAHCFYTLKGRKVSAKTLAIVAGTPKRLHRTESTQELNVKTIKIHRRHKHGTLTNDIAILKLYGKLKLNDEFVAIIPLPNKAPTPGQKCIVTGWGVIISAGPMPDEAIQADITIRDETICKKNELYDKGMICANNINDYEVDSCQGDSGGPLICDGKITGIVSFGVGCGETYSMGYYTDVYHFLKWINLSPTLMAFNPSTYLIMIFLTINTIL